MVPCYKTAHVHCTSIPFQRQAEHRPSKARHEVLHHELCNGGLLLLERSVDKHHMKKERNVRESLTAMLETVAHCPPRKFVLDAMFLHIQYVNTALNGEISPCGMYLPKRTKYAYMVMTPFMKVLCPLSMKKQEMATFKLCMIWFAMVECLNDETPHGLCGEPETSLIVAQDLDTRIFEGRLV